MPCEALMYSSLTPPVSGRGRGGDVAGVVVVGDGVGAEDVVA